MKIEKETELGEYQILTNLLERNPDFLRKYIKENLSKSQLDELFPEIATNKEKRLKNHQKSLKHLMITMSDDRKCTEEMFFGRVASYIASELEMQQENVKIYSKEANEKEFIVREFQEKDIDLIDQQELFFFPLRSGKTNFTSIPSLIVNLDNHTQEVLLRLLLSLKKRIVPTTEGRKKSLLIGLT